MSRNSKLYVRVARAEVNAFLSVNRAKLFKLGLLVICLAFVAKLTTPMRVNVGPKAKLEASPLANCFSNIKSGSEIEVDSSSTKT
jgi:hypothetical protein